MLKCRPRIVFNRPMKRIRIPCVIFSVAAVLIMAGSLYFSKPSLSERIDSEARRSGSFALAKLTDFKWDLVHILGPYQPREHVCAELPATWTQCASSLPPSVDEGEYLLVFVLSGNVVGHEFHSRKNGSFNLTDCGLRLTPADARFDYSAAQNLYVLAGNSAVALCHANAFANG